jgi:hypothetical protein
MAQWYELRVEGSAGTTEGIARGAVEGIAIGESGRLCSVASGHSKRFSSKQEAVEYLLQTTIPGNYRFEVVLCSHSQPDAGASPRPGVRPA